LNNILDGKHENSMTDAIDPTEYIIPSTQTQNNKVNNEAA
jgi:hypothetical protein